MKKKLCFQEQIKILYFHVEPLKIFCNINLNGVIFPIKTLIIQINGKIPTTILNFILYAIDVNTFS